MLQTLPYDILRILFRLLSGAEVAHVLITCKSLYALMEDDAIWQEQCAHYKLTDRAIFNDISYHEIFTLVLHAYGPLLGLWASDHPYKGSIIEFRYDREYKGIVGEVWRFWTRHTIADSITNWHMPKSPEYFTFFSISLPAAHTPKRPVINWHMHHNGAEYFGPSNDFLVVPTVHVLSETNESQYLHYHAGACCLPDFPDPDFLAWYDTARGLPRLKVDHSPVSSTHSTGLIPHAAFLYMSPTTVTKPAAVVFYPPEPGRPDIFTMHEPRLQVQDLRNFDLGGDEPLRGSSFYRRFYPLRFPVLDGDDPADEKWRPASLEGIWLGAYASHGTEVLYIYFDEAAQAVRALKITGDLNVPRGVLTWQFALSDRMGIEDLPHSLPQAQKMFGDLSTVKIYRGTGTVSGTGFV